MRAHAREAILVALLSLAPGAASAQQRSWPAAPAATHAIEEAAITGIGLAATALVLPVDARVRAWAQGDPTTHLPLAKIETVFGPMGERLPLFGSAGVALVGWWAGKGELRDAGMLTGESLLATIAVKGLISRIAGRSRPQADPHEPGAWQLMGGLRDREHRSFPSGHASNAFALAAAVTEELHHIDSPFYPWVGGLLFTAATATSFSRVLQDEHWLSDVIAGMLLGGLTGAIVADANGR